MAESNAIEEALLAPGAMFEVTEEQVMGERTEVFAQRMHCLRDLMELSRGYGDSPYLVFDHLRLSYADHYDAVAAVAHGLQTRYGIKHGDRVAILAANCPEWILAFWASVSLGAVVVGMNGWWTADEIEYALDNSEPKLLIADGKRLQRLSPRPAGERSVAVLEIEKDFDALWRGAEKSDMPTTAIDEDDAAVILYTSGTTGRPKGAVNTHRNILALLGIQFFHGLRSGAQAGAGAQHCRLNCAPLFHVSGLYSAAIAQLAGGVKSVWTMGRFDPERVLQLIEAEKVNGWGPMGTMAVRVVNHPDRANYDLSSMESIGCGGAPVTEALQQAMREAFPNAALGLGIGYGQTECTGLATIIGGEELTRYPNSVGKPLPTVQVEIRDADGKALPDGEVGGITVRGPLVMKEYWRNPEATAEAIGPGRWLRTGDVGRIEDGRLYIATRGRDMILRAAENVYPVEIENRLAEHPAVDEAAVFGVDHPELGQEVKAVVVTAEGASVETDALTAWVGETLAYYKVPSLWELRSEALPRNATGKVMKWLLQSGGDNPLIPEK